MLDVNNLLGFQSKTPQLSEIWLQGCPGFGSANSTVARFTTLVTSIGEGITYQPSSVLGDSFVINVAGVFTINFIMDMSGTSATTNCAVTKNAPQSQLAGSVASVTPSSILAVTSHMAVTAGTYVPCPVTTHLFPGDTIRAMSDAGTNGSNIMGIRICQIA